MTRRVLITGCSSGIGLALARRLAAEGWQVLATLRDTSQPPDVPVGVEFLPLDLADSAVITQLAGRIDRLDALVDNAGYGLVGPFSSYSLAQMQHQLQVNFLGPAQLTQALLPALRRSGGRIVVLSSMAGETGLPFNSFYCASKFALEGWAEALAHELPPQGVQIALVEPGGHRTRFGANQRWGENLHQLHAAEQQLLQGFRALLARRLAQPGKSEAAVVDAVMHLLARKRMPLRTRVGGDAIALRWLKALLPESWAQRLLQSQMRRMLTRPDPRAGGDRGTPS
ncbi:MAG: SDR family oxidoreductase [Rhodanobacteraceae bacterium]|nr:SDR family oxidoreductase [Rhodanobacteraceae bacterium]